MARAYDLVDISRAKEDFADFLGQFGTPIYRRYFTSASSHPYYGTQNYGVSTTVSFNAGWRYVTAEDYRLITAGRAKVGDAIAYIPSGVEGADTRDEFYVKGASSNEYFNVSWKQQNMVGSQVVFYECGLTMARGRR